MTPTLERHPGWIVCRNLQQIPVPSIDVLPRWAERGRLRPNDYLVNPALETCFQVKGVPDLKAIFRKVRMRPFETIWHTLFGRQW
jgi:hypothetical protein